MLLHSLAAARAEPQPAERPERLRLRRPSATSSSASRSAAHLGPCTASLVRAAEERGIPWMRLNEQSLIQLGHGKYQQRIQATVTSRTPHIAVELASDKEETNRILGDARPAGAAAARWCRREDDAVRAAATHRLSGGGQAATTATTAAASRIHLTSADAGARRRSTTARRALAQRHRRELHRRATTTACWWSTASSSPSPSACPGHVVGDGEHTIARARRDGEPAIRAAASATRRC